MSLEALQRKAGVTADGVFGKQTLKAAAQYYKLTNKQAAHFFGQCAHETGDFRLFSENLNYSADALMQVFPRYFLDKKQAERYARQPELIANRVYANRMGNGNEASGDGWRYRGRGAIQLTGKGNYREFADSLGRTIDPDDVAENLAFESAKFFFDRNRLWAIADRAVDDQTIVIVSRRINGGNHGILDRKTKTYKYYAWLNE